MFFFANYNKNKWKLKPRFISYSHFVNFFLIILSNNILVSGVKQGFRHSYTLRSDYLTIHSYYDITDQIPYAVYCIPVTNFITDSWYFLILFTFFCPSPHPSLIWQPSVICICGFVSYSHFYIVPSDYVHCIQYF